MLTLSDRLRWARGLTELSAKQLARLAGLHETHVTLIERGHRTALRASTISKLAGALGVRESWLWGGSGRLPSERSIRAAVREALIAAKSHGEAVS